MFKRETKKWWWVSLLCVSIIVLLGGSKQVQSQEKYPTRPIEIIGPYRAGGANDAIARVTADWLKKKWGVPVNVVNRPGGDTVPANILLYQAQPDGYTVFCDQTDASVTLEVTRQNLPFKVFDRTWIGTLVMGHMLFVVPSTSPHKTFGDVVAEIKRDPENFTWGSYGGSGSADTCSRQLFKAIGVDVRRTKPVVCGGGAKCAALSAGGHVKMGAVSLMATLPSIEAGTLRAVASIAPAGFKFAALPDLPSTGDLGYPTVSFSSWLGFSGPPKLPSHVVDKWNKELEEMTKDPEVASVLIKRFGLDPTHLNSVELKQLSAEQSKILRDVFTTEQ